MNLSRHKRFHLYDEELFIIDSGTKLDKVKIGDIVTIKANYGTFKYKVESTKIAKETDMSSFPIQHERELLMMYTCWPINRSIVGRKTQRYVVYAVRIGDNDE